jgi:hypothetical protein
MPTPVTARASSPGEFVFAAYRQAWLAGLGAAAVTRDWLDTGASRMLRSLVKEGSLVEAKAMRTVEARVESSYAIADAAWRRAQHTASATLREARAALPAAFARLPLPARVAAIAQPIVDKVAPAAKRAARPARTKAAKRHAAARRPAQKAARRTRKAA